MKRLVKGMLLFTVMCMIFNVPLTIFAHDNASEHNDELESVLFEKGYSKFKSTNIKNSIKYIEDASYITIDQFSQSLDSPKGKKTYNELKNAGMLEWFSSFDDIDYNKNVLGKNVSGTNHRLHTHQGWQYESGTAKSQGIDVFIDKRRKVLLSTLNNILDFDDKSIFGGYSNKCNALAGIIYYVHILGDYDEALERKKISSINYLTDLSGRNDGNNLIDELIEYSKILFKSQSKSTTYKNLMDELEKEQKQASKLYKSSGGINTDDKFTEYCECANQVMETLQKYMPDLLKKESFFKKVFYPN